MGDILDDIAGAINQRNEALEITKQQLEASKAEITHLSNWINEATAAKLQLQTQLDAANAKILELEAQLSNNPTPPPPPSPSGAVITTDIPTGWKVSVHEDFTKPCAEGQFAATYPVATSKIGFYPRGYFDTRYKQNRANGQAIRGGEYSADFISVANSICTQRMFVRNNILQCSALVPLGIPGNGKWGDAPGMIIEHRSRFLYSDGIKSAHLLWPQVGTNTTGEADGTGGNGEIDFPEFEADDLVDCFIHHQGATVGNDQYQIQTGVNPREWHTYRLMWKMGQSVTIWVDGVQKGHYTTRIPSTPMHCVLQNESWLTSLAIPANAQGTHEMDWVRILVPA